MALFIFTLSVMTFLYGYFYFADKKLKKEKLKSKKEASKNNLSLIEEGKKTHEEIIKKLKLTAVKSSREDCIIIDQEIQELESIVASKNEKKHFDTIYQKKGRETEKDCLDAFKMAMSGISFKNKHSGHFHIDYIEKSKNELIKQIAKEQKKLDDAVSVENYELAAEIRNKIISLKNQLNE